MSEQENIPEGTSPPTQDAEIVVDEEKSVVPDLATEIENALADPKRITADEAEALIKSAQDSGDPDLKNRAEELKRKLAEADSALEANIQDLLKAAGVEAGGEVAKAVGQIDPASVQRAEDGSLEVVTIASEGEEPKKMKVDSTLALITLVAADMFLFKGSLRYLISDIKEGMLVLMQLKGGEIPLESDELVDQLVRELPTKELYDYLVKRRPNELYDFLEGMNDVLRQKLFSGKPYKEDGVFSILSNDSRPLEAEEIKKLRSLLNQDQLRQLRLDVALPDATPPN